MGIRIEERVSLDQLLASAICDLAGNRQFGPRRRLNFTQLERAKAIVESIEKLFRFEKLLHFRFTEGLFLISKAALPACFPASLI